jgi:hypothetical protein
MEVEPKLGRENDGREGRPGIEGMEDRPERPDIEGTEAAGLTPKPGIGGVDPAA